MSHRNEQLKPPADPIEPQKSRSESLETELATLDSMLPAKPAKASEKVTPQ